MSGPDGKQTLLRTSTILVAVGNKTRIYRSAKQMPAELRRRLEKTTTGTNSATILIADKRGREEILRAVRGRQPEGKVAPIYNALTRPFTAVRKAEIDWMMAARRWAPLWATVLAGAAIWGLLQIR